VAWNPLGQASTAYARLPVTGAAWKVLGPSGASVAAQVSEIDNRTLELPLLYINKAGMKKADIEKAKDELSNKATHILTFPMTVDAVGYGVFAVSQDSSDKTAKKVSTSSVSNGVYTLEIDQETNEVIKLSNKAGASTPLNLQWGWYNSSVGGCTVDRADGSIPELKCTSWRQTSNCDPNGAREPKHDKSCDTIITRDSGFCECEGGVDRQLSDCSGKSFTCAEVCAGDRFYGCDGQKSGAYMFRPNSSEVFFPGPKAKPTLEILQGDVVTELYQKYSDWVSHVIRLYKDEPFVEVEWTVGPIPVNTEWLEKNFSSKWGKEVIIRYNTDIDSEGTFYTDSNGREMVKREFNKRPSSYPELVVTEPVAGNYYPINAMASIDDGKTEFAVLTDATQGGASLTSGSVELMVHRRIQEDDSRGVAEPLDETMCGCRLQDKDCDCAGLTMRGRHWLILDTVENANQLRRTLSERQNFGPTLAFGPESLSTKQPTFSALSADLPANIKLQTLTNNYASMHSGKLLFRLSHLYSIGEHPTLSQPVQVDLKTLFGSGYSITDAEEMSASAGLSKETVEKNKYQWKTEGEDYPAGKWIQTKDLKTTLRPMEVKTFVVTFEKNSAALV